MQGGGRPAAFVFCAACPTSTVSPNFIANAAFVPAEALTAATVCPKMALPKTRFSGCSYVSVVTVFTTTSCPP